MNSDGSDLHQVAAPGGQASFTPDGQHLVYECPSCDGGDGIFLMRDDGSDAPGARLSTDPFAEEGDSDPQASPDGGTVTFVRHKEEGQLQALVAVDAEGSNERMVVPFGKEVAIKHDWAPSGGKLVVTLWADFPNGKLPTVATADPDGSDLRRITNPHEGQATFAGSFSPDGRWIASATRTTPAPTGSCGCVRTEASARLSRRCHSRLDSSTRDRDPADASERDGRAGGRSAARPPVLARTSARPRGLSGDGRGTTLLDRFT